MALASLTVDLTLGLAKFEGDSGKAAQIIARDAGRMAAAGDKFLASLQRQADAAGKSRVELLALKAAQLGVSDAAAASIAKINAASLAAGAAVSTAQLKAAGHDVEEFGFKTAGAKRELLVLAHELSQGNFSRFGGSLLVLGERTGAASLLFSGLGVAALGAAGAVAAVVAAIVTGAKQIDEFNASLILTGNAAGTTAGQLDAMAKAAAVATNSTVGTARDALQQVVGSGLFGPALVQPVADAVVRMQRLTGDSADKIVADFSRMADGVTKYAVEHNKSTHLLSTGQVEYIRALEEAGKTEQAQGVYIDALNVRLAVSDKNIGLVASAWAAAKSKASEYINAVEGIGRGSNVDRQLAIARERLADLEQANSSKGAPGLSGRFGPQIEEQRQLVTALENSAHLASQVASATARSNAEQAKGIDASEFVSATLKKAKSVDELAKALTEAKQKFADLAAIGRPVSASDQTLVLAEVRKEHTDHAVSKDGNAARKASLEQDLKALQDQLAQERDALSFHQRDLQGIYNLGEVSLADFYDRREALTAAGVQAELATLSDERARLQAELASPNLKQADRIGVETRLQEAIAKSAKVETDAANAAKIASTDRALGLRSLSAAVNDYRANLFALAGDELAAAQIRQQAQLVAASRLASDAGGDITDEELTRQARLTDLNDQFAEAQRRVSIVAGEASRAEEVYTLRATQTGTSLRETEQGIYAIRAASLVQLGELAEKAKALADASADPKLTQAAADLALQYQKAAESVDPAINRLRDAGKDLGSGLASDFSDALVNATKLSDVVSSLEKTFVKIVADTFVQKPLENYFQGQIRGLTEGSGAIGDFFKNGLGSAAAIAKGGTGINSNAAGYSTARDSQTASEAFAALTPEVAVVTTSTVTQATAVTASTSAITAMATAAGAAAQALAAVATTSAGSSIGSAGGLAGLFSKYAGSSSTPTAANYVNSLDAGFPLADGTNYVPYDGFRAVLHKGESVTPAKFNPAAGGQWQGAGDGSSSKAVEFHQHITIQGSGNAATDRRTADQIGKAAYQGASRAARRNG